MHHLPTSLVSNERANCIVYRSLFPVDFHLWSWYHCFLLHRRLRGGWLLYRVSASPGSLESHSIVGQTLRQLKPQLCLECWPAGLRWPALLLLPGLCDQPPMRSRRSLKGTRCCCQSAHRPRPQVGNSIWQRKEESQFISILPQTWNVRYFLTFLPKTILSK